MDLDDIPKKPKPPYETPVLDGWSARELEAYLTHLRTEIARTEAQLAAKPGLRGAAEALFRR